MKTIEKNADFGILILRLLVAGLLMFHGFGNLISGYAFIKSMMLQSGLPEFLGYGAFIGEIIAPAYLLSSGIRSAWPVSLWRSPCL